MLKLEALPCALLFSCVSIHLIQTTLAQDRTLAANGSVEPPVVQQIPAVPIGRMKQLMDQALADQQVISDLNVRMVGRDIVFDVTLSSNPGDRQWLIQLNLAAGVYASACARYESDGYQRLVDRTIDIDRRRLHSVVWMRDAAPSDRPILRIPEGVLPEAGASHPMLQPLDTLMRSFLRENNIPGCVVAVARDGQVMYERGFGYAELQSAEPMKAETRLRIASVSKPITAVGILKLIEQGLLDPDSTVLNVLKSARSVRSQPAADPRWNQITIRHLLQHRGGWDREVAGDPMFQNTRITQELHLSKPPSVHDVIRFQLQKPLNFNPGEKFCYSNFGYCLLGRVIEEVSGMRYAEYIQQEILQPAGMVNTRPGRTRLKSGISDESHYYTQTDARYSPFWEVTRRAGNRRPPELVPAPYGRWELELLDSIAGWTSTAGDLLKFVIRLHDSQQPLLQPPTKRIMLSCPDSIQNAESEPAAVSGVWYGCGWNVGSRPGAWSDIDATIWHNGGLDGSSALLVHRTDGYAYAILFNVDFTASEVRCSDAIERPIQELISRLAAENSFN